MRRLLLVASATGLATGGLAHLAQAPGAASWIWATTIVLVGVPLAHDVVRALARRQTGVDLIALLAMGGALALKEHLAGAVIALMLAGGQFLEDLAGARARRELTALLARAPRTAILVRDGATRSVGVDDIDIGDTILVPSGAVVPVDGLLITAGAVLDESALTGESRPTEHDAGGRIPSGAVNAGGPFELRAVAAAAKSTYAGIVRLVQAAQDDKAPFVRMADRYAGLFLPVTLVVAAGAWIWSGDPVRALAVLVVATPCPLILAAPIAIVSGISQSARRGIIVKGGGALEALASARHAILDKTGTVTAGRPSVTDVEAFADLGAAEILRLAASLDQVSAHVFAESILAAARLRQLPLTFPSQVVEEHGAGITGRVGGRTVRLGRVSWVARGGALPAAARRVRQRVALEGTTAVFVAVDGQVVGAVLLDDPIRPEAPGAIRALRRSGVEHIAMVTGDVADIAELVGEALGVDRVLAERSPAEKVAEVTLASGSGPTIMVGDGINDAPALAAADVGVALGARGATASSEAADVVLVVDRLDRLVEARQIAQRARGIALQSVLLGMGLSFVAMGFAAVGMLGPVAGAMVQEGIDLAAILNALRALRTHRTGPSDRDRIVSARFRAEHLVLLPRIDDIRGVADRLDTLLPEDARTALEGLRTFLIDDLLPHEEQEEAEAYPAIAGALGGQDPLAALTHGHRELTRLVRLFTGLLDTLGPDGPDPEDHRELRRLLYRLHAVLRLHFAQEEQAYAAVDDGVPGRGLGLPARQRVRP